MARKRSTARVKIPKATRRLEAARRLFASLRGDVADTFTRTTRGETEKVKRNPWPRCEACLDRQPPQAFICGKHVGMCTACCGYPHDDEDGKDEGDHDFGRVGSEDDDEDGDNDDHH